MATESRVVVGVDGSASARHAALWGAREAARRGAALRLVHGYAVPDVVDRRVIDDLGGQGESWLRAAADAVAVDFPDLPVETVAQEERPVPQLLGESDAAELVVLGSHGLGGFTGMLIGSTAVALAAHGRCTIVVVRGVLPQDPPPVTGPVLVGVDDSTAADDVLAFAFEQASARRVPLVALHTWNDVVFDGTMRFYPLSVDAEEIEGRERRALSEQLAGWQEKYPHVPLEAVVEQGRPVRSLLEHGKTAQLIVVGSRGRRGFTGMLLGSTSQALLSHTPCPVAVLRLGGGKRQRTEE